MAKDIYQVDINQPIAWKLDGMLINFDDNNNDLLATGVQLNYSRQLASHFPLNTNQRVIVAAAPQGTLNITSIVGPYGDVVSFLNRYGDVCNINKNNMSVRPGGIQPCEGTGNVPAKFTLTGCLISTFGLSVQNQNGMGVVNSTIQMSFVGLKAK